MLLPDTTCVAGGAQACVRTDDATSKTLDARLREFYALAPCELSTAELARLFANGDERQIQRAHVRIRRTHGADFVEQRRTYGRTTLPPLRSYRKPGGSGRSQFIPADVETDLRDLDLQAKADRARRRSRASRKQPTPRHRATRLDIPRTPLLETPISIEAGVLAGVESTFGARALRLVLTELREQRCHDHPDEARLAVRTLVQRTTDKPVRLFRFLFGRALEGDLLIDAKADAERVRLAELAERRKDPDFFEPGTTAPGAHRPKTPVKIGGPPPGEVVPTGPPRTADPSRGAAFLERFTKRLVALGLDPGDVPF